MKTALAAQLVRLRDEEILQANISSKPRLEQVPRLSQFKDADADDILHAAQQVLSSLSGKEQHFDKLCVSLFSNDLLDVDIVTLTPKKVKEYTNQIQEFIALFSPYFVNDECLIVLDWLFYKFEIHKTNLIDLVLFLLVHYQTNQYTFMLQKLSPYISDNSLFIFFKRIAKSGLQISGNILVQHLTTNLNLLQAFNANYSQFLLKFSAANLSSVKYLANFFLVIQLNLISRLSTGKNSHLYSAPLFSTIDSFLQSLDKNLETIASLMLNSIFLNFQVEESLSSKYFPAILSSFIDSCIKLKFLVVNKNSVVSNMSNSKTFKKIFSIVESERASADSLFILKLILDYLLTNKNCKKFNKKILRWFTNLKRHTSLDKVCEIYISIIQSIGIFLENNKNELELIAPILNFLEKEVGDRTIQDVFQNMPFILENSEIFSESHKSKRNKYSDNQCFMQLKNKKAKKDFIFSAAINQNLEICYKNSDYQLTKSDLSLFTNFFAEKLPTIFKTEVSEISEKVLDFLLTNNYKFDTNSMKEVLDLNSMHKNLVVIPLLIHYDIDNLIDQLENLPMKKIKILNKSLKISQQNSLSFGKVYEFFASFVALKIVPNKHIVFKKSFFQQVLYPNSTVDQNLVKKDEIYLPTVHALNFIAIKMRSSAIDSCILDLILENNALFIDSQISIASVLNRFSEVFSANLSHLFDKTGTTGLKLIKLICLRENIHLSNKTFELSLGILIKNANNIDFTSKLSKNTWVDFVKNIDSSRLSESDAELEVFLDMIKVLLKQPDLEISDFCRALSEMILKHSKNQHLYINFLVRNEVLHEMGDDFLQKLPRKILLHLKTILLSNFTLNSQTFAISKILISKNILEIKDFLSIADVDLKMSPVQLVDLMFKTTELLETAENMKQTTNKFHLIIFKQLQLFDIPEISEFLYNLDCILCHSGSHLLAKILTVQGFSINDAAFEQICDHITKPDTIESCCDLEQLLQFVLKMANDDKKKHEMLLERVIKMLKIGTYQFKTLVSKELNNVFSSLYLSSEELWYKFILQLRKEIPDLDIDNTLGCYLEGIIVDLKQQNSNIIDKIPLLTTIEKFCNNEDYVKSQLENLFSCLKNSQIWPEVVHNSSFDHFRARFGVYLVEHHDSGMDISSFDSIFTSFEVDKMIDIVILAKKEQKTLLLILRKKFIESCTDIVDRLAQFIVFFTLKSEKEISANDLASFVSIIMENKDSQSILPLICSIVEEILSIGKKNYDFLFLLSTLILILNNFASLFYSDCPSLVTRLLSSFVLILPKLPNSQLRLLFELFRRCFHCISVDDSFAAHCTALLNEFFNFIQSNYKDLDQLSLERLFELVLVIEKLIGNNFISYSQIITEIVMEKFDLIDIIKASNQKFFKQILTDYGQFFPFNFMQFLIKQLNVSIFDLISDESREILIEILLIIFEKTDYCQACIFWFNLNKSSAQFADKQLILLQLGSKCLRIMNSKKYSSSKDIQTISTFVGCFKRFETYLEYFDEFYSEMRDFSNSLAQHFLHNDSDYFLDFYKEIFQLSIDFPLFFSILSLRALKRIRHYFVPCLESILPMIANNFKQYFHDIDRSQDMTETKMIPLEHSKILLKILTILGENEVKSCPEKLVEIARLLINNLTDVDYSKANYQGQLTSQFLQYLDYSSVHFIPIITKVYSFFSNDTEKVNHELIIPVCKALQNSSCPDIRMMGLTILQSLAKETSLSLNFFVSQIVSTLQIVFKGIHLIYDFI
ncbi:MAG: snoRNA-binding rRNA-processing protein utp10 [Paramarteilia canceri]